MTGQTLLPMPMGAERIFQVDNMVDKIGGNQLDVQLRSNIEEIVIKWASQINEILSEESSHANNSSYPLPNTGNITKLISLFNISFTPCVIMNL